MRGKYSCSRHENPSYASCAPGSMQQHASWWELSQAATGTEGNASYYSDTYIEEEANYAMVDNQEIYAYLLAEM